jgi:hypothetical protein
VREHRDEPLISHLYPQEGRPVTETTAAPAAPTPGRSWDTASPSPATCCISWCQTCLPEIGVHEAAPIPAPGGEIRLCNDPDVGVYLSDYAKTETLSIAEAKAKAYAILAMVARAETAHQAVAA